MSESWVDPLGAGKSAVRGMGAFTNETVSRLRDDGVDESVLFLAWELARWPSLSPLERAAFRFWVLSLLIQHTHGSSCLPDAVARESLAQHEQSSKLLPALEVVIRKVEAGALSEVFGRSGRPLVRQGNALFTQKYHSAEQRVAQAVLRLCDCKVGAAKVPNVSASLSEEQLSAVNHVSTHALTILTGGPGTGKSTVIVSMVENLLSQGFRHEDIVLSAPTGKAADRLSSALREARFSTEAISVSTLHRLLGYSPSRRRFLRNESDPINAKVVIVDECSMIDLQLFDRLLRALPSSTKLVLVGDPEQLPPVGVGAVFQDLCDHPHLAKTRQRLNKSFRMDGSSTGAKVLRLAQAISKQETLNASLLSNEGVNVVSAEGKAKLDFFEEWFAASFQQRHAIGAQIFEATAESVLHPSKELTTLFSESKESQLLCFTRVGRLGSLQVNEWFHTKMKNRRRHFYPAGEPLIVTRNDYARGLFNGDMGMVLLVRMPGQSPQPCFVVEGPEGWQAHPVSSLSDLLEPAYAITVHKAQGSEYKRVGLLVSEGANASKQILYTGVTRAKERVTIVGTADAIHTAATTIKERHSGLSARLSGG